MRAGFGKVDITPPLAVPYLSFHPRMTPFEGIHDRLYARAVVLDNGATKAAIVAADGLGFSRSLLGPGRDFVEELRTRASERCGVPREHLLLNASHSHSTPQTTDIVDLLADFPHLADWTERLLEQMVAAVVEADACREEVVLSGAEGEAPDIAWNRRILAADGRLYTLLNLPDDAEVVKAPKDDRVPVLLIRGETRRGALFGFTCHPTTVQVQPLVSADFPGVAAGILERELELEAALFIQGTCGDITPVRRTSNFEDVTLYGRSLAGEALRALALQDTAHAATMSDTLAGATETVEAPRRALPEQAVLEAQIPALERAIDMAAGPEERRQAIGAYRAVMEPLRLCRLGSGPVPVEVQALRVGEALFVGIEGELFVELGLGIKDALPAPLTFMAGYSNGYQGYLITREAWEQGGYEPSVGPWTRVAPGAAETVAHRARDLAIRVWEESS